ncbi:MAG: hypothetical protein JO051_03320 [Acidobacteriaceae bacterium]|nr:hypothetical protein [Acidobacteriaceae bacterium]
MNILARIRSYDDLAAALKTERKRQGMSQTKLEQSLEWDYEYLWKLETLRKYPAGKLADWLRGLGVELALVKTADLEAAKHTAKEKSFPSESETYRYVRKINGAKGARARNRNLSRVRRREIARNAANARHAKNR